MIITVTKKKFSREDFKMKKKILSALLCTAMLLLPFSSKEGLLPYKLSHKPYHNYNYNGPYNKIGQRTDKPDGKAAKIPADVIEIVGQRPGEWNIKSKTPRQQLWGL